MKEIKRGWQSTLDRIPAHLKPQLIERIEDTSLQQKEILTWLNLELACHFAPDGMLKTSLHSLKEPQKILKKHHKQIKDLNILQISSSALNRYATATLRRNNQIRDAREAAESILAGMKEDSKSDLGRAVTELIKSIAFDLVSSMNADDNFDDVLKRISKLAIIAERVSNADKNSTDRIAKAKEEMQKEALEQAASIMEDTAKEIGLSTHRVKEIKEKFLGTPKETI